MAIYPFTDVLPTSCQVFKLKDHLNPMAKEYTKAAFEAEPLLNGLPERKETALV